MKILFLAGIIFILYTAVLPSQTVNNEKYKLGQSFENGGDFQGAARIYESLHQSSPDTEEYFQALVRVYKAMNRYSELIPFLVQKMKLGKTPSLLALYGELLWRTGKTSEANDTWNEALDFNPPSLQSFTDVAQSQITLRLYDKAIATFEAARKMSGSTTVFSDQLTQLYVASGNYEKGAAEIMNLFEQTSNIAQAQGYLQALLNNKEAETFIDQLLKKKAGGDEINYLKLYSWFLRVIGKYDDAFVLYQKIDRLTNAKGREVFTFAELSAHDEQYDIALKAYSAVIDMGKTNPYVTNALFGYARTLEHKLESDSTVNKPFIESVIEKYRSIIKEYPGTPSSSDCQFRIAYIYINYLNNPDMAADELKQILESRQGITKTTANAANLLGDIYVLKNQLDDAELAYSDIVKRYGKVSPADKDKALYKLAEIYYFRGEMDTAKALFTQLTGTISSEVANDALGRIVLLDQNKEFTKGLRLFAQAELAQRQNKFEDAVSLYEESSDASAGSSLADECLLRTGKIFYARKSYAEARENFERMLKNNEDGIFNDYALLMLGYISEKTGSSKDAINYFTRLLSEFPRSIYLNEARGKIRKIRAGIN